MADEECKHSIVHDGACENCGLVIDGVNPICSNDNSFTTNHPRGHKYVSGYFKELDAFEIPNEVKSYVKKKIESSPHETHRSSIRRNILFAYILCGYIKHKYEFDPYQLADKINFPRKNIRYALQLISGVSANPLPQNDNDRDVISIIVFSPIKYIGAHLKTLGLEKIEPEVTEFASQVINIDRTILEENPVRSAIAIIKYFLGLHQFNYPKYYRIFNIEQATLKACSIKIEKAYGKLSLPFTTLKSYITHYRLENFEEELNRETSKLFTANKSLYHENQPILILCLIKHFMEQKGYNIGINLSPEILSQYLPKIKIISN
jgi:hypothetical protein